MRRFSVSAAALVLASPAVLAQTGPVEQLPEIEVVAPSPVAAGGAASGLDKAKIPFTVESAKAADLERQSGRFDVLQKIETRTPGVALTDAQGNPNRMSLSYRGFEASPVQGAPQGVAVYQNGARINEAFGDVVNWDLIPSVAINRVDLFANNPAFGLNALGGAANIEMKNGFLWQGTEATAMGGSRGRVTGSLQHGRIVGPWSIYGALEGLNDPGWRRKSPSRILRGHGDIDYRHEGTELHVSVSGARSHVGAAAATPVEMLAGDSRAIFTNPQTTTTELGQVQISGKSEVSPSWTISGGAYLRRLDQKTLDGNPAELENCSSRSSYRGSLCLQDDAFVASRPSGTAARRAWQDRFALVGPDGRRIAFDPAADYATLDRSRTRAASIGASLQATGTEKLFGLGNHFIAGAGVDHARYTFQSGSTLGLLNPDLSITASDPTTPGIGVGPIRTLGSLGYGPTSIRGTNTYFGLFASDTLDLTERLSVTAGARLNHARVATTDRTGLSPDLTAKHRFTRLNPMIGATYRLAPEFTAYASYAESNRAPTPLELSCADPARPCLLANALVADPPLKQVVGRSVEAGLRGKSANPFGLPGSLSWKLGAYHTSLRNDIIPLASAIQGRGSYVNVPATWRRGAEIGAEYEEERFSLYANYALVDATYRFNGVVASPNSPAADANGDIFVRKGNHLPLVPRHQFKAGIDVSPARGWRIGVNLTAFSSSFFQGDQSNQNRKLPGYAVVGLTTSYKVSPNFEIVGAVTNLFNRRYARFGAYTQTGPIGAHQINDPRSVVPGQPLTVTAGLKMTW